MPIQNMQTPVGRLVWGNPAKPTTKKDQRTKQVILREGQPVQQWAFGVAFPKHEFEQFIKPYFEQEARSAYPHGVPQGFSWKYKDGDSIDRAGKPYSLREGYAGHYVLNISTEAFAPPIFKLEGNQYRQIAPEEIKTGDYVALNINVKVNVPTDPTHTPGLYVNPNGIELVGYGAAIQNSANPDEMFGGQKRQLPPGASATPIASSAGVGMPIPQQQPYAPQPAPVQPYAAQPAAPAPQGYPAPAAPQGYPAPQGYVAQPAPAAAMPPPAYDFVQNAGNAATPAPAQTPYGQPPVGAAPTAYPSNPAPQGYPAPAAPQGYPQPMQGLPPAR